MPILALLPISFNYEKPRLQCKNVFTGRIQFEMRTVRQTKSADFMTINSISIELSFNAISTSISMHQCICHYLNINKFSNIIAPKQVIQ